MGKASSSKKVARAARTGGGRTKRGATSWFWPVFIGVVVVLGTAGIAFSKNQQSDRRDTTPPRMAAEGRAGDHWHTALGINVCGRFLPNITDEADPLGIHTHADGVVHVHPARPAAAGRNARLKVFLDAVGGKVSETEIRLPGQETKRSGMRCGDKPAQVRAKVWPSKSPDAEGTIFTGDPGEIRFTDGQLITVAFLPEDEEIPRPPSAEQLDRLTDVPGAPTTVPGSPPTTAGTDTTLPADASTIQPPAGQPETTQPTQSETTQAPGPEPPASPTGAP